MNALWGVPVFHMSATSMYAIHLFIFYNKINLYHVNFILDSVLQDAHLGLHNVLTIHGSTIKKLVPTMGYGFPFSREVTVSCQKVFDILTQHYQLKQKKPLFSSFVKLRCYRLNCFHSNSFSLCVWLCVRKLV